MAAYVDCAAGAEQRRRLAGAERGSRLSQVEPNPLSFVAVRVPVSHARPQQIVEHAIVPIQRATPVHLLDAAQGMPRDELPVQMRDARALVAPRTPRLRHAGIPLHRPVQLPTPRLCLQARLRQRVSRRPRARLPRERPHHLSGEDATTCPPTSRNNGFETPARVLQAGGQSRPGQVRPRTCPRRRCAGYPRFNLTCNLRE